MGNTRLRIIGWDIGGAHLKAARIMDGQVDQVVQLPCPIWLGIDRLQEALAAAHAALGTADLHGVTMTGELSDIFADRTAGVAAIACAFAAHAGSNPAYAYRPAGFVTLAEAAAHADAVASANWHAMAALAARFRPDALVADMGSTTTDLIPVSGGVPCPSGFSDAARLASGELVYTGLVRTALMAVAGQAPFGGAWTGVAREYFATMADVYRLLGELPDGVDVLPTADGREKTPAASRARLARMVGRDAADASEAAWTGLAAWFAEAQLRTVTDAALLVRSRTALGRSAPVVAAGAGRHVIARMAARLGRPCEDFADLPVPGAAGRAALSHCAPAVAVAMLVADSLCRP